MVEIVNAQSYEPTTVDEALRIMRNGRPEDHLLRLVAELSDGELAGYATGHSGLGSRPGEFSIIVRVDHPFRTKGIGRQLYAEVEQWALSHHPTALTGGVREVEPESLAWAERRGFRREHHIFKSRLDLPAWDPAPFLPVLDRLRAEGLRFADLTEVGMAEENLHRFYEFIGPIISDMPGAAGRERAPYERWRRHMGQDVYFDPKGTILALDRERWAAFAVVRPLPSGVLTNAFTGVERSYRGRGLALGTKVVALTYAKSLGARSITTSNHSVNQPMLAINRRLGYQPLPGSVTLRRPL